MIFITQIPVWYLKNPTKYLKQVYKYKLLFCPKYMDRIAIFIHKTDFFGYFLYLFVGTGIIFKSVIFLSIILFLRY